MFHIKISTAFQHLYELIPENSKLLAGTLITAYDSCTMLILCGGMKLGYSFGQMANYTNFLGIFAAVLYLLIVPESPKWLFLTEGEESINAIKNLNYIAWFNGSNFRIPDTAIMDIAN